MRKLAGLKPTRYLALMVVCCSVVGCAINPATGKRQLSLISESQEISMGREADQQASSSLGLYGGPEMQSYVQQLGEKLAAKSERPDLPWTFRVVDDPMVNAFALPGGYIYVTRGIMAHMNSEAELVSVLGHEIGHVTARHSVNQMSKAQLATLGLGVSMAVKPELQKYGDLTQTGLGLLFLKYGRDDERQADELGLRYLRRAGYDPRPMTELFTTLERVSQAQGAGRIPNWLSTHPHPAERREDMEYAISQLPAEEQKGILNAESYLARLEGMVFGEDPRQGFFQQTLFLHPEMEFQLRFPAGWKTQNTRQAVTALHPNRDALVGVQLASQDSAEAALRSFFEQTGARQTSRTRSDRVNGLHTVSAEFAATLDDNSVVVGKIRYIAYGGNMYQLLGYATQARWQRVQAEVRQSFDTFKQLRDRSALAVQPMRVTLVKAKRGMPLEEFARRYPSSVSVETFGLVNHLLPGEQVTAGRTLKRIIGGP